MDTAQVVEEPKKRGKVFGFFKGLLRLIYGYGVCLGIGCLIYLGGVWALEKCQGQPGYLAGFLIMMSFSSMTTHILIANWGKPPYRKNVSRDAMLISDTIVKALFIIIVFVPTITAAVMLTSHIVQLLVKGW